MLGLTYGLLESKNIELTSRYLELAVRWAGEDEKAGEEDHKILRDLVERTELLLSSTGRMKFVRPLYSRLKESCGAEKARKIFEKYRDFYHPICRGLVEKDLYSDQK